MLSWIGITIECVNGFHSNMGCFEAPFKGSLLNVKLFKYLEHVQIGPQRSQKDEFYELLRAYN